MKKILYIVTALFTFGFNSCDIDDVENYTELSQSVYPATDEDVEAVLAGVYQNLNAATDNESIGNSFLFLSCLASDEQFGCGSTGDKVWQALDLMLNYGTDMCNDFYTTRYSGIARANTLVSLLEDNESVSEDSKNTAIAEAKFLRAFFYYELASMFGNVPLSLDVAEDAVQGEVTDVWAQILMDLRDACDALDDERKSDGHVDKYTAEAMLARAWLFYTGFYCNGTTVADLVSTNYSPMTSVTLPDGSTLTKDDVIDYIDDCVNNSGYELVPDFRNLWAYTNRYTVEDYPYTAGQGLEWVENDNGVNPESMFAIKYNKLASWSTTTGYANEYALYLSCRGGQDLANTFPFGQGWGAGMVAPNLVDDWEAAEPNDMRLQATICDTNDTETEMPAYEKGGWDDAVQETDYYSKKWSAICAKNDGTVDGVDYVYCFETLMYSGNWDTSGENNFQLSNIHDVVLIRFADALLMQSELKEDVSGINMVRERAGLDPIASYSLEALQNERRWELACEGIRWNDIRRWHIAATALAKQQDQPTYNAGVAGDTNSAHNGGYAVRYNATAGFQKMPDSQVDLGVVVQNEGWTTSDSEYAGW